MKKQTLTLFLFLTVIPRLLAQPYQPHWESLNRRHTPNWFQDAKFGIFIHWGVYAVPAWGPKDHYAENYAHHLYTVKREVEVNFHNRVYGADFRYEQFAPRFRAELFDAAQWAELFQQAGARYVVITSKHTDSFCLWPAPDSKRWNSVEIGPRRNVLAELTTAVRAKGLKMGFYYCLLEWYHPYSDLYQNDLPRYVETRLLPQLKDLVLRFQPDILWGDGEWDHPDTTWRTPEFLTWLFNESPVRATIAINDRWGQKSRHKNGGYYTSEYSAGFADASHPWEENRGMGHSYGYNRNETLASYHQIPVIMEERLLQIGAWLQVNGAAIYGTRPFSRNCQWSAGEKPRLDLGKDYMGHYEIQEITGPPRPGKAVVEAFFTQKEDTLYAIVPRWPGKKLVLHDIQPLPGSQIVLLGEGKAIPWQFEKGRLILDLSRYGIGSLPCEYAWAFRIILPRG